MDGRREAEELVRLWQELQEAQVAGNAQRLEGLRRHAEAESRRPGASEEWALLEREAGRHTDRLHEAIEAQPSVGVGDATETVTIDAESAPEPVEGRRGRGKVGSLIWLAILLGWVALQIIGGLGDE